MTTVAEITGAVKRLPTKDLARFRKWFAEYDATVWDRQIESDGTTGKLLSLAREAHEPLGKLRCAGRLTAARSNPSRSASASSGVTVVAAG